MPAIPAGDTTFAARYWGVLNRLRDTATVCYAEARAASGPRRHTTLNVIVAVVIIVGVAWLVTLGVYAATGGSIVTGLDGEPGPMAENLVANTMLALPGLAFVGFGARAAVGLRRRAREGAEYDERRGEREAWRRAFDELGSSWGGTVSADGIGAAMRFLADHHPECAPVVLLHHQAGNEEDRITLVATKGDAPLLVQVIDNSKAGEHLQPPVLVVLVASPIDMESTHLDKTAAHGALTKRGFVVGWTAAGAYAIHPGPLAPYARGDLSAVIRSVVDLCRSARMTYGLPRAPRPPMLDIDESDVEVVAAAFLSALRDRDALGALALAHPMLFPRGPREPTAADLDRAIDGARARPTQWEPASVTNAGDVRRGVRAQFADRPDAEAHVHLSMIGDRWTVAGYAVGNEQVIGLEFEEPSS